MAVIHEINKLTDRKFVNLYEVIGENSKGHHSDYMVASRAPDIDHLKIKTGKTSADGVAIYSLYGEKHDRVVIIRQYRYSIGRCIYELPAGLVEEGESFRSAAIREMHEETGLTFTPIEADPMYEAPRYTTIGLTDEACATVYGFSNGTVSDRFEEQSEEIEVVLADRDEVRRILREEEVALLCAYQMMHFLYDKEPFAFLKN